MAAVVVPIVTAGPKEPAPAKSQRRKDERGEEQNWKRKSEGEKTELIAVGSLAKRALTAPAPSVA
jgi:hypothetical protein